MNRIIRNSLLCVALVTGGISYCSVSFAAQHARDEKIKIDGITVTDTKKDNQEVSFKFEDNNAWSAKIFENIQDLIGKGKAKKELRRGKRNLIKRDIEYIIGSNILKNLNELNEEKWTQIAGYFLSEKAEDQGFWSYASENLFKKCQDLRATDLITKGLEQTVANFLKYDESKVDLHDEGLSFWKSCFGIESLDDIKVEIDFTKLAVKKTANDEDFKKFSGINIFNVQNSNPRKEFLAALKNVQAEREKADKQNEEVEQQLNDQNLENDEEKNNEELRRQAQEEKQRLEEEKIRLEELKRTEEIKQRIQQARQNFEEQRKLRRTNLASLNDFRNRLIDLCLENKMDDDTRFKAYNKAGGLDILATDFATKLKTLSEEYFKD